MARADRVILSTILVAGAGYGAYETHQRDAWHFEKNEAGSITGIARGPELLTQEAEAEVQVNQYPPSSTNEIESELKKLARTERWCSSEKITYSDYYIPGLYIPKSESTDTQSHTADLCIDPNTIQVGNATVLMTMGTQPAIPQIPGNPSIFLTYLDPNESQKCVGAKEEMRELAIGGLARVLTHGDENFNIRIHVDSRNHDHPCDDGV